MIDARPSKAFHGIKSGKNLIKCNYDDKYKSVDVKDLVIGRIKGSYSMPYDDLFDKETGWIIFQLFIFDLSKFQKKKIYLNLSVRRSDWR